LPIPGIASNFLRIADQVCDLLREGFDGLGGVAVGTDAEGILPVDFEQVGGFVEDAGDGLVVHGRNDCSAAEDGWRACDAECEWLTTKVAKVHEGAQINI
jgi:hypothetical protein